MAGVALDDMDFYFAWQAWHLWHWVGSGGALGQPWRRDAAAFCVAGVALRDICLHFAWQAWHFVTSTVALCGRRVTGRHRLLLCMAGVALMALGWLWWRAWSAMAPAFCVAGVALRDIYLHFVWQAWHLPSLCVAGVVRCRFGAK